MSIKNEEIIDYLRSAYGGESMAHMRYLIWGDNAKKQGFENIGRLLKAVAYSEKTHANNYFSVLKDEKGDSKVTAGAIFGLTNILENLQGAISGETHEINEMYPEYIKASKIQGEKEAEKAFHYALEAEKCHAKLLKEAERYAKDNEDIEDYKKFYVCPICGYTIEGEAPEKCPVCGAVKESFKEF